MLSLEIQGLDVTLLTQYARRFKLSQILSPWTLKECGKPHHQPLLEIYNHTYTAIVRCFPPT